MITKIGENALAMAKTSQKTVLEASKRVAESTSLANKSVEANQKMLDNAQKKQETLFREFMEKCA